MEPLLLISSNQSTSFLIRSRFSNWGYALRVVESPSEFLKFEKDFKPGVVMVEACAKRNGDMLSETVSFLKKQFSETKILVIYSAGVAIDASELFHLGIHGIFQYPFEEELLTNTVFEYQPPQIERDQLSLEVMTEVSILELKEAESLPFDVYIYLPANEKFLLYRKQNDYFDKKTVDKFVGADRETFFIKKSELRAYYDYMGTVLSKLIEKKDLEKVENRQKLKTEVKNLLSVFFTKDSFSETEAQVFNNTVQNVVSDFLGKCEGGLLFQRISDLTSRTMTNYAHCMNTASYCVIFGLLLDIFDIETLSVGGLLHDIGLAEVPPDILEKDLEELPLHHQQEYKLHPLKSMDIIKRKEIPVSDIVKEMIEQHHENPDGSGYPRQLKGDEISPFAKILALADYFDEATSIVAGRPTLSPTQALQNLLDPEVAPAFFDPDFHKMAVETLLAASSGEAGSADVKEILTIKK